MSSASKDQTFRPARALTACLALAAGAGVWAGVYPAGCAACQGGAAFFGLPLGWLGAAFYGGLLALHLARPGHALVAWGLLAAGGAHLALAALLLRLGSPCMPCLLAAGAAWTGVVLAWRGRVPRLEHVVPVVCAAALLTLGAYFWPLAREHREQQARAEALLPELRAAYAEHRAREPEARWLVLYEREGCAHCALFKEEHLPEVLEAYPAGVELRQLPAPDELWAPTIAALGPLGDGAHAGLPTPGMLWSIVPLAFGPPQFAD